MKNLTLIIKSKNKSEAEIIVGQGRRNSNLLDLLASRHFSKKTLRAFSKYRLHDGVKGCLLLQCSTESELAVCVPALTSLLILGQYP